MQPQPKSALPGVRFPALPSEGGGARLAMQFQLEASERSPYEELLRNQRRQIQSVLEHAQRTVPYYRRLFGEHGLAIAGGPDPDFLQHIPVSTRAMIQEAGADLRSGALPPAHGRTAPVRTSGSTGKAVELLGTEVTEFFWHVFVLRDHLWHQRDFTRKLCVIRWASRDVARPPDGQRVATWGGPVDSVYDSGPSCMLNVATPVGEQLEWLARERPAYLLSYPSNLAALADHCLRERIALPGLLEVRTMGEMLTEQQRALLHAAWGCKVTDIYTCEEAGYLALQCPSHDHYHVQSENVWLEIVGEDRRPCAPGVTGHVLITTLHNFATPLIRYELGDLAEFGEPCPCGRSLPVIRKLRGRKRNRLALPGGRSEFPYLGEHGMIRKATGVRVTQFQYIQHSVEEIELRLVCDRPFTAAELEIVERIVQTNLGHPFHITITYWDAIPKSPREKFEEFVSRVES